MLKLIIGITLVLVLMCLLNYCLCRRWCYRKLPKIKRDEIPAAFLSASPLLWLFRFFWTIGILCSPQNLLFMTVDRLCGYVARAATDLWNDILALKCRKAYFEVRPKPRFDIDEWAAVLVRDCILAIELAIVLVCIFYMPAGLVGVIIAVYIGFVKIAYNLRSGIAHLRNISGVVWNRHRTVLTFFLNFAFFVVMFAVIYRFLAQNGQMFGGDGAEALKDSSWAALYYSMVTITTLGYGDIDPSQDLSRMVMVLELFTGFFMLAVLLQSVAALLVSPDSKKI